MTTVSAAGSPGGHAAVMERWFAAYNAHDLGALCELADPAVVLIPLPGATTAPPGTSYHGHDGLRTLFQAGFDRFPQLHLDHGPPVLSGNRVTVELEFVLDDGTAPPQVKTVVGEFRIAGGRIRRMRAYDRSDVARSSRGRADSLSPREREILSLIARGMTVADIAAELVLSPLTVRTHVRNAKERLRARTTTHAVAIALDEAALDP